MGAMLRTAATLAALATLLSACTHGPTHAVRWHKTREITNRLQLITLRTADLERAAALIPLAEDFEPLPLPSSPETVAVKTREVQTGWLRAAGIEILDEQSQVPRAALDASYRARRGLTPQRDEAGDLITGDGYHDAAMVEALLHAYAKEFPHITRLEELGRTWEGRPILALLITDHPDIQEDEPALLLNGAHHGNELLSIEPVLDAIEGLTHGFTADPQVRRWVEENEIWCVPVVNPDGLDRHWHLSTTAGRNNARDLDGDGVASPREGVDLNRNYPFRWGEGGKTASSGEPGTAYHRGPAPGSEPETQAMMHLVRRERFVFSVSYHTAATSLLVPYTIDKVRGPHPSPAWAFARGVLPRLDSTRAGRPYRLRRQLYPVDGTDHDWFMHETGALAYLLELPLHNPGYGDHRDAIVRGARPLWQAMLDRIEEGPTLTVHVVDAATGEPHPAEVSIDEIPWHEGERFTAHPQTGRFDFILPAPGTYHLRVSREGYETVVREADVGREQVSLLVCLRPD